MQFAVALTPQFECERAGEAEEAAFRRCIVCLTDVALYPDHARDGDYSAVVDGLEVVVERLGAGKRPVEQDSITLGQSWDSF